MVPLNFLKNVFGETFGVIKNQNELISPNKNYENKVFFILAVITNDSNQLVCWNQLQNSHSTVNVEVKK